MAFVRLRPHGARRRIAISGGHTPKNAFALLADPSAQYREQIPWENLELYWVDERCVPPDHPDSNYRMTREALLDKVPLSENQIFRIRGELEPEAAASRYEFDIRQSFRLEGAEMPVFDMVALGMGPDGHTASLFPHTEGLHELMRIAIANHVPQQKESWRVTLTWPVINRGRDVFFLIEGARQSCRAQAGLHWTLRSGNLSVAVDQACHRPHYPAARCCCRRCVAPARCRRRR